MPGIEPFIWASLGRVVAISDLERSRTSTAAPTCRGLGQDYFLDNGTFNHRFGQFALKKRADVSQLELARRALSDLLHLGVHAAIAAFAYIAQHAIDMDGVDVGAFRHWRATYGPSNPRLMFT